MEALQKFHHYYGDDFRVECPTGSGTYLTLSQIADELSRRLISLFVPGRDRDCPFQGAVQGDGRGSEPSSDASGRNPVLFHEYFDGDTGKGLGARHQTGWTGLVAELIQQQVERKSIGAVS